MPLTVSEFRKAFPAFTEDLYPDEAVQYRLDLAADFFVDKPWKAPRELNHAQGLFVAHHLAIAGSAASGGASRDGSPSGLVASKSVDGASISFDTSSTSWAGAGYWNQTPYGKELWWLMQLFGAGAVQL